MNSEDCLATNKLPHVVSLHACWEQKGLHCWYLVCFFNISSLLSGTLPHKLLPLHFPHPNLPSSVRPLGFLWVPPPENGLQTMSWCDPKAHLTYFSLRDHSSVLSVVQCWKQLFLILKQLVLMGRNRNPQSAVAWWLFIEGKHTLRQGLKEFWLLWKLPLAMVSPHLYQFRNIVGIPRANWAWTNRHLF